MIRGIALGFLVLLCACSSRGSTGIGSGPLGMDVANAALKGGSPEIALQIAGNVLAKNPGNEDALLTQGDALTELGRPDEAASSFEQVLLQHPDSVSANIGLGRIKLASDPTAAEALFLTALRHEPRNGVALNDLGISRDLQGRHTDAQTAYREALGVSPDMSAAQVNLALSLAMSGRPHDAVDLLQPIAGRPDATQQSRHDLAAVLAMSGDKAGAQKILSKDLPPEQVQQALDAYTSAGTSPTSAASLLAPGSTAASVSSTPPMTRAIVPDSAKQIVPASSSEITVQLAASPSRAQAEAEWNRLRNRIPEVMANHSPLVAKAENGGQDIWRLRTAGFANASEARAFCQSVRATGGNCIPLDE